uniref:Second invertase-like protein n=1 Tax=Acidithiobacillus ferridurans TaxID=1232575 RepID=O33829_ACIFI|nr:second invertase-like protein [Acidithiobacillus ferridurans]
MLVGYMRVSSDSDRQSTDLQRDALPAGVDPRHLFEDHASGAKDDRAVWATSEFVCAGDVLVVWKLDRLGLSLSHLLAIVTSLKDKQVAFRSLTESLDTTTPSGEFLFQVFGALAQYERALIQERVVAGLAQPRKRAGSAADPQAITGEKLDAITAALDGGMSKAAVCRTFGVKRTTLIETLARAGCPSHRNQECSGMADGNADDQWLLAPTERELVMTKNRATRLGFALLLTFFRERARFPRDETEVEAQGIARARQTTRRTRAH